MLLALTGVNVSTEVVQHLETLRSTRLIELELDYELVTCRRNPITLRARAEALLWPC